MATTTNYGWVTPDDTSLVKDGANAIRTLGSSVDTTTKALNPSTTLGDIEYRSSTANTNTRLPIGTTGQILTVSGGVPTWATGGAASWQAFTPTWTNLTVGNGTTTARYVANGKLVSFWVKFTLGSTSSVGTEPSMNYPLAAQSTEASQAAHLLYIYEDSGLSRYQGIVDPVTQTSTAFRLCALNVSSTYGTSTQITSSIPFTWGTGDSIYISGTYEAA